MTWDVTTRGSAGAPASIGVATSPNPFYQTRLRGIYCTLAGSNAGAGTVVVRDGPTALGLIIFEVTLVIPANGRDLVSRSEIELRATVGNLLTIEFLAGTTADFQSIHAIGDYIPLGVPYGATLDGV